MPDKRAARWPSQESLEGGRRSDHAQTTRPTPRRCQVVPLPIPTLKPTDPETYSILTRQPSGRANGRPAPRRCLHPAYSISTQANPSSGQERRRGGRNPRPAAQAPDQRGRDPQQPAPRGAPPAGGARGARAPAAAGPAARRRRVRLCQAAHYNARCPSAGTPVAQDGQQDPRAAQHQQLGQERADAQVRARDAAAGLSPSEPASTRTSTHDQQGHRRDPPDQGARRLAAARAAT